jgi:hypothetical protein
MNYFVREVRRRKESSLSSFYITAKCRYNASIRLKRAGHFSFLTATILSLGLILVPVLQLSGLKLAYPSSVLNSLQIFLAVAVLVYSVINGTAHYEVRAQSLNDCGDSIKELHRVLRTWADCGQPAPNSLSDFNDRYSKISSDSENHSREDYSLATLQAESIFRITGIPRVWLHAKVFASQCIPYIVPGALMAAETLIICDTLGVTHVLTPTLNNLIPSVAK